MKYITYVFYYAKELLMLSMFLTMCYVFFAPFRPLIATLKIVLPFVFFAFKKYNDHTTLYFLYNLGMRNRTIICILFFLMNIDLLLLQFIL